MAVVGIICEYNPLHLGHQRQLRLIREQMGQDTCIVALMSGNFVQRGEPAIVDKSLRTAAALDCGADLVLEMPVTVSLRSAEGFADGSVAILTRLCTHLCFGTESAGTDDLMHTAEALLSQEYALYLRQNLDVGMSFPAARQAALQQMGLSFSGLEQPNHILALEYCKAILAQSSTMQPFPIHRPGSYHARTADAQNPSATAVRSLMQSQKDWMAYVPAQALPHFQGAALHTRAAGERAILSRLRTMSETEFAALPFGSEGLWRKLMHESRRQPNLDAILTAVKSKRYTMTRLNRMVMCAFLGIDETLLHSQPDYIRVLGFTSGGQALLSSLRKSVSFVNIGTAVKDPFWKTEQRVQDLYGLFCTDAPEASGLEPKRRVVRREAAQ